MDEELLEEAEEPVSVEPASCFFTKHSRFAVLGLAAVGAALVWLGGGVQHAPLPGSTSDITELVASAADPCVKYPFVRLEEVVYSNLGKQGPDKDKPEGIVYKATDLTPGKIPKPLKIHVHASTEYKAGHASYNGIHGKYGLITLAAGNKASFRIEIHDAKTDKMLTLAEQYFTFFDLDQSKDGSAQEFIQLKAAAVLLTKGTEVKNKKLPDGSVEFRASKWGNGDDNPSDPLALTVLQKNRAVTAEFINFDHVNVTLGCEAGSHARYFMFVARPSLVCALTTGSGKDSGEDKIVAVVDNTKNKTWSADKQVVTKSGCWITVPITKWCIPHIFR